MLTALPIWNTQKIEISFVCQASLMEPCSRMLNRKTILFSNSFPERVRCGIKEYTVCIYTYIQYIYIHTHIIYSKYCILYLYTTYPKSIDGIYKVYMSKVSILYILENLKILM